MIVRARLGTCGGCTKLLQPQCARTKLKNVSVRTIATTSERHASTASSLEKSPKSGFSGPSRPNNLPDEHFFRFTRGRFVSNEKHEISQRYVRFNIDELGCIAAAAVGSKSCVKVEKYFEGMHNKAPLLTMDDGTKVVAKVPNPNAGRPHFAVASEFAIMDFVSLNR